MMWGAVMVGMGFVKKFPQLAALRAVLGFFEAGFFPSCVYLLSTWYTRCEYPHYFK
jgi:sugar phosphate permease